LKFAQVHPALPHLPLGWFICYAHPHADNHKRTAGQPLHAFEIPRFSKPPNVLWKSPSRIPKPPRLPTSENKGQLTHMEDRIPIPTDNIFKFYALFGLLLFVFCSGSIIYVYHSTNELVFQVAIELETIQQNQNPSPVDKLKMDVLMKRLDIAINDRK